MKIFIASDIHGSARYCQMMLEAFLREGADKLVILGDILYHGPRNPLPEEYSPKYVAEMLTAVKRNILCVRGNCDSEVDQMVLPFPILNDYAVIYADGLNIYLAHGHKRIPPLNAGDVYVTGHTHVPLKTEEDGIYRLNPGSISLPKENSPRGYIVYERGTFAFKTLEGEIYDILDLSENNKAASEHAQPQPEPAPYVAPVPNPVAEPAPYVAPVPNPVAEPAPYVAPVPNPVAEPAPYVAPVPNPVAEPAPYVTPVPNPVAEPAPYVAPVPNPVAEPAPYVAPVPNPVAEPTPYVAPVPNPVAQRAVEETVFADAYEEQQDGVTAKKPVIRRKIIRRRR